MYRTIFLLGALCLLSISVVSAQEDRFSYNPLSLYPVSYDRMLFKRQVWYRVDLNEKQNKPFFSREREISRLIIQAVKNDLLIPYVNDSVNTPMTKSEFLENIKIPEEGGGLTEEEKALGFGEEEIVGWGDESTVDEVPEITEFDARDFSIIEIKQDYFFDNIRSRMYHDIHVITLILPADKNPALFEKPVASFRFVDLAKLFRSMPQRAIWYNAQNPAKHLNMIDAFLLRLFSGNIVKISNPDDNRVVDIYSDRKQAVIASQQIQDKLIDSENQLWEY